MDTRQMFIKNTKKWSNLASCGKPEACGQTKLPDRSILIGPKLAKNAKIEKFNWDILGDFQTMCASVGKRKPTFCSSIALGRRLSYGIAKQCIAVLLPR